MAGWVAGWLAGWLASLVAREQNVIQGWPYDHPLIPLKDTLYGVHLSLEICEVDPVVQCP